MKEMVGGCCVCSDERGWPENPLVYCDGQNCTVAVHQACYGIVTVPKGPWYCRKCESQERSARVRCELCPSRDGALKRTDNQGWAHVVCALYIPEVRFGNVTTMEPIILQLIPQERYAKSCYICQEIGKPSRATFGACMQCNKSNCKQQFHVTCAQSLGLLCEEAGNYLDNVKYCGYCQHHYSKLKKGGNVKTIPPYKPINHDTSSDSGSSPGKELDTNISASSSTVNVKITTNLNNAPLLSNASSKQRKSGTSFKQLGSSSLNGAGSSGLLSSGTSTANIHCTNSNSSTISSLNANVNSSLCGFIGNNVGGGNTNIPGNTLNNSTLKLNCSGSTSNYKDKDKNNKSQNKPTNSSRDKDGYSSSSSRESREKSTKSSKSKELTNSMPSTLVSSISSTTNISVPTSANSCTSSDHITALSSVNSTLPNFSPSSAIGQSSNNSNLGNKEIKLITSTPTNTNFLCDTHVSGVETQKSTSANTETGCGIANNNTNIVGLAPSSLKSSNVNSATKKRKIDAKSLSTEETNKDIIKDVSVTLTPLQQTDFEKEIERSSKKQRTELSPSTNSQIVGDDSSSSTAVNSPFYTATTSSSSLVSYTAQPIASSVSNTSIVNTAHKHGVNTDTKTSTVINLSISNINKVSGANSSSAAGNSNPQPSLSLLASSTLYSEKEHQHYHRDDRSVQVNSKQTSQSICDHVSAASTPHTVTSAPSLYVSVPLSTANVLGINLPSTAHSSTIDQPLHQSTRINNQPQVVTSHSTDKNAIATSTPTLTSYPSPHIHRQSPTISESPNETYGNISSQVSTASIVQSSNSQSVMHHNSKPSSPNTQTSGNLTAITTENGNLKISYEKQTVRVEQLKEQDTVPTRRNRLRPGESNISQSYQPNQQQYKFQQETQHQQQSHVQQSQKASSRSVRKRAITVVSSTAGDAIENCGKEDPPADNVIYSSQTTRSPTHLQNVGLELFASSSTRNTPLTLPPPTSVHSPLPIEILCESVTTNTNNDLSIKQDRNNDNNSNNIKINNHNENMKPVTGVTTLKTIVGSTPEISVSNKAFNISSSSTNVYTNSTNSTSISLSNIASTTKSVSVSNENNTTTLTMCDKEQGSTTHKYDYSISSHSIGNSNSSCSSGSSSGEITGSIINKSLNKKLLRAQQTHYQQQLGNQQQHHGNFAIQSSSENKPKSKINNTNANSSNTSNKLTLPSFSASPMSTNIDSDINTNTISQLQNKANADVEIVNISNTPVTSSYVADTAETTNFSSQQPQNSSIKSQQKQHVTMSSSSVLTQYRTTDSGMYSSPPINISITSATSNTSLSNVTSGPKFTYEPQVNTSNRNNNNNTGAVPLELVSSNSSVTVQNQIKDSPPSSPNSEGGTGVSVRKRGRKGKDVSNAIGGSNTILTSTHSDLKDIKILLNGNTNIGQTVVTTASSATNVSNVLPHAAAHMLGNQINPSSNVAQKLSDQLHMEIQDHSIYTPDAVTPQYSGVPFPGKLRQNTAITNTNSMVSNVVSAPGANSLASMFGSSINGNLAIPQSLEQLLERQWEQGSQFLMEQAQHFDIASLLSCLHQLQTENVRLEEHVTSLIARRDHLLAVNARLAIPLNANVGTTNVNSQTQDK